MDTIETTGRTVDEARQAAAQQLGVAVEALDVAVVEESKGLFGKTQVRIRATASVSVGPASGRSMESEPLSETEPESAPKPAPKRRARSAQAADPAPTPEPTREPEDAEVESPDEEEVVATREAVTATEADADHVVGVVNDIIAKAELEATAQVVGTNGRYVSIEIIGRDAAHLVGKNGEVLNALQYLVNLILSRHYDRDVRATLDGNHYRQRREDALRNQATAIANEVRDRGEEAVLPPLPAFERRVVHNVLHGMAGITTYSEGEEPNRRVVIAPSEA